MSGIERDLNVFYDLMASLEKLPNQGHPLAELIEKRRMPLRGVYFFREPGEVGPDGAPRIVRVGTHAMSEGSKSTLHARLKTHLGSRSGSGNHRGSIFRLHIGHALLLRDGQAIPTWGKGSVAPPELRNSLEALAAEAEWEKKVSHHIGRMEVLWVDVPDEPSPTSMRAVIERNSIGLLSCRRRPSAALCTSWLGGFSKDERIRTSNLWNVRHVDEAYDTAFLKFLGESIERTEKTGN